MSERQVPGINHTQEKTVNHEGHEVSRKPHFPELPSRHFVSFAVKIVVTLPLHGRSLPRSL
jgi:hypothetical protein